MKNLDSKTCNEIFVRLSLFFIYKVVGLFDPLDRKIQPEEIWFYRYPHTKSYCSNQWLWSVICVLSIAIILTNYLLKNDEKDLRAAILSITLCIAVTAVLTRLLKIVTGKPRPDFYWRCFPNGYGNDEMICNGNKKHIREGRQSFPSGHASLAFSGFGFVSLYLMGKLRVYEMKGSGESWRFLICLSPLVLASMVGISRICDYHHHAIDVFAGTILGCFVSLLTYHHYYPPFYKPSSDVPYSDAV